MKYWKTEVKGKEKQIQEIQEIQKKEIQKQNKKQKQS